MKSRIVSQMFNLRDVIVVMDFYFKEVIFYG
jgi:hypothetical protein